jgi:hypothetical protein
MAGPDGIPKGRYGERVSERDWNRPEDPDEPSYVLPLGGKLR